MKRSPFWDRQADHLRAGKHRSNDDIILETTRSKHLPHQAAENDGSFVLLASLPHDQLQLVFSYSSLNDLLSLSAASKYMYTASESSHYLLMWKCPSCDEEAPLPSTTFSSLRATPVFIGGEFSPAGADAAASLISDRFGGAGGARQGPPRSAERPVRSRDGDVDGTGQILFRATDGVPLWRSQRQRATVIESMSRAKILAILGRFRHLRFLELKGLSELGDSFLPILNSCQVAPSLVSLCLRDVRIVRDGYRLDLQGNKNGLQHIKVIGTMFVSYKGVLRSFTLSEKLRTVALGGCRSLADKNVADIISRLSATIKALSLPGCSKLSMPNIQCDGLENLELNRCLSLKALPNFNCPRLLLCDLSFNTSLNDEAVQTVISRCANLQRLILKGCSSLRNLEVRLQPLLHLDVSLCSQLKSVNVRCEQLALFEAGMCRVLESMTLSLGSIEYLDLSMLPLSTVVILAPNLKELNLSGCFALHERGLQYDCQKLEKLDICGTNLSSESLELHLGAKTIREGGKPPLDDWNQFDT